MSSRNEWQSRIKAVEREYVAMRQAADHFHQVVMQNPTLLHDNLQRGELVKASRNLEGTYVIRLFAEFETAARQYWETMIRDSRPKTEILLDSIASRQKIPNTQRVNAQVVRDYRNILVHQRDEQTVAIPIKLAQDYLCHFLSFLPWQW